ncbi:MAG: helix-turn-helix domain-containing protein [Methylocystis sp.]|nr:helix-turn-helix domain-containing protein [Methylocystis sp.]MCA3583046.1 helix-turn-helix domain-containing protein [Methylocystis sp.]MCA3588904.1 helix-turn-helix domain-containing protein [Methylocystis sp.]MCA3590451.1 helix-turn-helix domain-containing protein [Methylocystis sp.]
MNVHKNPRSTPLGREVIARRVMSGQTPKAAAQAAGVCPRTVRKWMARFALARASPACRTAHRGPTGSAALRRKAFAMRSWRCGCHSACRALWHDAVRASLLPQLLALDRQIAVAAGATGALCRTGLQRPLPQRRRRRERHRQHHRQGEVRTRIPAHQVAGRPCPPDAARHVL